MTRSHGSPAEAQPPNRAGIGEAVGSASWGPVSHAIVRVAHLHRRLAGDLLRQVGLHPGQELLLMLLWDQDDRPQSELVCLLGVEAPTVTKTLQRLEQQQLVVRHRPAANRRTVVVSLTDSGRGLHREVEQLWATLEEATTVSLTETERRGLSDLLDRVEKDLAEAKGQAGGGAADGC